MGKKIIGTTGIALTVFGVSVGAFLADGPNNLRAGNWVFPITFIAALIIGLGVWVLLSNGDATTVKNRPIVKVWTRDGITAVCANEEYDLWYEQYERAVKAKIEEKECRPAPKYAGYFTNDPAQRKSLDDFWIGSMEDYRKIVEGCRIERSELFIPSCSASVSHSEVLLSYGCIPIMLPEELYHLIHGKPAPSGILWDE